MLNAERTSEGRWGDHLGRCGRLHEGFADSLLALTHASAQSGDVPSQATGESAGTGDAEQRGASRPVSGVGRQFNRYARALAWVARDALPRWRSSVLLIVACNVLGLLTTLAAVGGVMAFARAAEKREPVNVLGRTFEINSGMGTLIGFGAVIALLGLISAACMFIADRLVLTLARRYHTLSAERAIALAADPRCRGWQIMLPESPRAIMLRLTGSGSRAMAFVLRDMLRIILPILAIAGSVGFLIYLDSKLTLALLPLTALYLLPLYLINRRVMRMQRLYRERSPEARREVGERLRDMLDEGHPPAHGDAIATGHAWAAALNGLYGRLLADRRVQLLNAGFFILCLVAILLYFGVSAAEHGRPWSDLIFYLLALRYAMAAIKQSTALLAKFSRFFPEFHFYSRFIAQCEESKAHADAAAAPASLPETLAIRIGRRSRWESQPTIRLHMPACLFVFVPAQPGHADMEAAMLRIQKRLADQHDLANLSTYIVNRDGLERLQTAMHRVAVLSGFAASRPEFAKIHEQRTDHLPGLMVIVDNDPVRCLQLPLPPDHNVHAVVIEDHRLIAGGNLRWLKLHHEEIAQSLEEQAERLRRRGSASDAQTDDDEAEQ